jgi:hypothetical protein
MDLQHMKRLHGIDDVWLRISFPDNFPFDPPFVRVLAPLVQGGYVLSGGALSISTRRTARFPFWRYNSGGLRHLGSCELQLSRAQARQFCDKRGVDDGSVPRSDRVPCSDRVPRSVRLPRSDCGSIGHRAKTHQWNGCWRTYQWNGCWRRICFSQVRSAWSC